MMSSDESLHSTSELKDSLRSCDPTGTDHFNENDEIQEKQQTSLSLTAPVNCIDGINDIHIVPNIPMQTPLVFPNTVKRAPKMSADVSADFATKFSTIDQEPQPSLM